jgi:hypothetical protein
MKISRMVTRCRSYAREFYHDTNMHEKFDAELISNGVTRFKLKKAAKAFSGTATTKPRPKQKAGNFKAGFKLAVENAAMIAKYGRVAEWSEDDDDDDDSDNDDTDSITEDDGETVM